MANKVFYNDGKYRDQQLREWNNLYSSCGQERPKVDEWLDKFMYIMDGARSKLLDYLGKYQVVRKCRIIAVFDAYRVQRHNEEKIDYDNIHVVYTREAQTADHFIERFTYDNHKKYDITVATSGWPAADYYQGSGLCRNVRGGAEGRNRKVK